ncbi:MAG: UDP-N-acetylglucosamine 2-epimerase (non-hydrolyzing) [Bacteroidia bacterium]
MKIVTVIGARPQIIKAAALSRAIRNSERNIREVIVHTGQHYDENMSEVFIRELGIPQPDYNLQVGSGSHGKQTAAMITGLEEILLNEKPDWLVVYGDTNSTLAGAVAASKIHIPVAHIEAGLRSFNKSMPEEINRILCDHVSALLFSPTPTGYKNLIKEGFKELEPPYTTDHPGIFQCGDLMYDNSLFFASIAEEKTDIYSRLCLNEPFILATIHRNANTDDPRRINTLFSVLADISEKHNLRIILPVHPRTRKMMQELLDENVKKQIENSGIELIEPASFLEMIVLEKNAFMVITDSGGVQKEAYYFGKPCIILRPETEWTEIVEQGCARICDADPQKINEAFEYFNGHINSLKFPPVFGDGKASEFIVEQLYLHRLNKN